MMERSLLGQRILVTRPEKQAEGLGNAIRALGGYPVFFPLLEIAPVEDVAPLLRLAPRIRDYAIVVFVSPNAVEFSLPVLLEAGAWPENARAAAIGPGTANSLARFGIGNVIVPAARFDSETLLELPEFAKERVEGRKVLIVRGDGGRELLADTLARRGAAVDRVTCYRRSTPADARPLRKALSDGLHALTVSSSEGLRNLPDLLDAENRERLFAAPVFVPHARIAETARAIGLKKVILTPPADTGIIEGLCVYFADHGYSC
ncbi:MAG: uroporphyrinogen-III synthase [Candidatus Accumulibacter sp.]|jgi:uroporphyrinogen-III synthase|nr:uroporphyrinogen-III synthase [Accumulibacter sp.]